MYKMSIHQFIMITEEKIDQFLFYRQFIMRHSFYLFIIGKHFPGIIHSNNFIENGHDQRGNGGRQAGGELHR